MSLRATAADADGNTVEQTIADAHHLQELPASASSLARPGDA